LSMEAGQAPVGVDGGGLVAGRGVVARAEPGVGGVAVGEHAAVVGEKPVTMAGRGGCHGGDRPLRTSSRDNGPASSSGNSHLELMNNSACGKRIRFVRYE